MPNPLRLVVGGGFSGTGPEPPDGSEDDGWPGPPLPGLPVSEPEPASEPEPFRGSGSSSGSGTLAVPVDARTTPTVLGWLSIAAGNRHLGGGPDGLAAYLKDPRPEPLITHVRHAAIAVRAARDPQNGERGIAAAKAAYHILFAIPVKAVAQAVKRGADIADAAPDNPLVLIFLAVVFLVAVVVVLL